MDATKKISGSDYSCVDILGNSRAYNSIIRKNKNLKLYLVTKRNGSIIDRI